MLERLKEEINRGTRVAGLFTNEASALRLVGAVLMEISEDWETGRKYLTMGPGLTGLPSDRGFTETDLPTAGFPCRTCA